MTTSGQSRLTRYQLKTILAIDTSCDETSAAVTAGERVLSNIISSQIELHKPFGGVVPSLAKREHQKLIDPAVNEALQQAGVAIEEVGAIAVTIGPGLAIALEVGIKKAKELAQTHRKPLIAVDHMEGHLLSPFARDAEGSHGIDDPRFPALGLLVSGGHTELVLMRSFGQYELIGQTLDDAAGECFDKVARILDLDYPGGPAISKLAQKGEEGAFNFPVPMKNSKDFNFSFSGLKTACLYAGQKIGKMNPRQKRDFAASFEKTAVQTLLIKLIAAVQQYKPRMVLAGGGVIANRRLREKITEEMERLDIPVYIPYDPQLLTDNAGMIGVAASYKAKRKELVKDIGKADRIPNLSLGSEADY